MVHVFRREHLKMAKNLLSTVQKLKSSPTLFTCEGMEIPHWASDSLLWSCYYFFDAALYNVVVTHMTWSKLTTVPSQCCNLPWSAPGCHYSDSPFAQTSKVCLEDDVHQPLECHRHSMEAIEGNSSTTSALMLSWRLSLVLAVKERGTWKNPFVKLSMELKQVFDWRVVVMTWSVGESFFQSLKSFSQK